MKRYLIPTMAGALVLGATMLASCSGGADSKDTAVNDFAVNFAQKASANQKDSLVSVYPDVAKADSLALTVVADSIKVAPTEKEGEYTVTFSDTARMTVTRGEDGTIKVQKTYGVFAFPAADVKFAQGVGALAEGMSDVKKAEVMGNLEGLKNHLYNQYAASHKNAVKLSKMVVTKDIAFMMDAGSGYYTLTNTTDQPIKGSEYTIRYEDWYMGPGCDQSSYGTMPGRDLPAHGSTRINVGFSGHSGRSLKSVTMKTPSKDAFLGSYQPTGKEYAEYVKTMKPAEESK